MFLCNGHIDTITIGQNVSSPDDLFFVVYPNFTTELIKPVPPWLLPYELYLEVGYPVIHLRILKAPTLCSGANLVVKQRIDLVIDAQIITGHGKNETVFILKIPIKPTDSPYPQLHHYNEAQYQWLKDVWVGTSKFGLFIWTVLRRLFQLVIQSTNSFMLLKEKTKIVLYEAAL